MSGKQAEKIPNYFCVKSSDMKVRVADKYGGIVKIKNPISVGVCIGVTRLLIKPFPDQNQKEYLL